MRAVDTDLLGSPAILDLSWTRPGNWHEMTLGCERGIWYGKWFVYSFRSLDKTAFRTPDMGEGEFWEVTMVELSVPGQHWRRKDMIEIRAEGRMIHDNSPDPTSDPRVAGAVIHAVVREGRWATYEAGIVHRFTDIRLPVWMTWHFRGRLGRAYRNHYEYKGQMLVQGGGAI